MRDMREECGTLHINIENTPLPVAGAIWWEINEKGEEKSLKIWKKQGLKNPKNGKDQSKIGAHEG